MQLTLNVVGGCRVSVGAATVSQKSPLVFAAALYIGIQAGRHLSRAEVAELLWPRASESDRGARLRWLLSKLRRLGVEIETDETTILLPVRAVAVDAHRVDRRLIRDVGAAFQGYAPTFSPAFGEWLDDQRASLTREIADRLTPALREAERARDWNDVIEIADAIRRASPLNEAANLASANAHFRRGDGEKALSHVNDYLEKLIDPDQQRSARAMAERIRRVQALPRSVDTAFVGRVVESRRIEDLLHAARTGHGGSLVIGGIAGIGKTRLLDEGARVASLIGVKTLRIRYQPDDVSSPLVALTRIVAEIASLPGAAGADPQNVERLRQLGGVNLASFDRGVRENPSIVRTRVRDALSDICAAVGEETPFAVLLDDIQWADAASLEFLQDLFTGADARAVLWVAASRASAPADVRLAAPLVFLHSLSTPESGELLDDLVERAALSISDVDRSAILERGAGSPLFLREIFRHWARTRSLMELPPSLSSLLESTLRRLGENARLCLQASAILGSQATLDRVERILSVGRSEFVAALAELELAGALAANRDGQLTGHLLWGEASLALLSPVARRTMHRHAAEQFDLELDATPSAIALWESVRHWEAAEYSEKARAVALRGADHLSRSGLLSEAGDVYGRLLAQEMPVADRMRLLRRRIDLLFRANRTTEVIHDVDLHEQLAAQNDPSYDAHNDMELIRRAALSNGIVWPFAENTISAVTGEAHATVAASLACARNKYASTAHRLGAAKQCVFLADSIDRGIVSEAWRIASQLTPTSASEVRDRLRTALMYEMNVGDIRAAVDLAERSRIIEAQAGPSRELVVTLGIAAGCYQVVGRIADARAACREAIETAIEHGLHEALAFAYDKLLSIAIDSDPPSVTRRLIDEMRAVVEAIDPNGGSSASRIALPALEAQLAVEQNRGEDALALIPNIETCMACPPRRSRARYLAIHLAARNALTSEDQYGDLPRSLESCFAQQDHWLDWPATVYVRFLCRFRPRDEVTAFADRYVTSIRRELFPAPLEIASFVSRMSKRATATASRRILARDADSGLHKLAGHGTINDV